MKAYVKYKMKYLYLIEISLYHSFIFFLLFIRKIDAQSHIGEPAGWIFNQNLFQCRVCNSSIKNFWHDILQYMGVTMATEFTLHMRYLLS